MMRRLVCGLIAVVTVLGAVLAADAAWNWTGAVGPASVTLLIVGDIDIQRRADPVTAFAHMRDTMNNADVVYANLEGMLVAPEGPGIDIPDKGGWRHPGPEGVRALKPANVHVVGVANNVAYDRNNLLATLRLLDENGIAHTGGGVNLAAAHQPAIVARKGVRIGFLQYTARWYYDRQLATANEPGVAKIASRDGITVDAADVEQVRRDIQALRPKVDIIVVSHHNRDGATATQFPGVKPVRRPDPHVPEDYQKAFAHLALDAGADLVYGHGTHTVQGVEVYKGKPILYAIGHSAFDQPGYEKFKDGLVVRAVIDRKHIVRVSFVPVTRDDHNDVMMIDPAAGEGARLVQIVENASKDTPLKIEGQEVVLLGTPARATHDR